MLQLIFPECEWQREKKGLGDGHLVDNPLGQVEDGVLVRLDGTGRVDQERQGRVDDVIPDGHRTLHAVAGDAPSGTAGPGAVGVGGAGAAFAQARLRGKQPLQGLGVGYADLLHDAKLARLWVLGPTL